MTIETIFREEMAIVLVILSVIVGLWNPIRRWRWKVKQKKRKAAQMRYTYETWKGVESSVKRRENRKGS